MCRMTLKLLSTFGLLSVLSAAHGDTMAWRPSYAAARAEAVKTGKPLMIYFTTTWCGYCKVMEKEAFVDADVLKQASLYVPVKLDAEKEGKALAKRYEVTGYPTFVLTDPKEKVLGIAEGYKKPKDFTSRIEQILNQDSTKAKLARVLGTNPNDGKANSQLAIQLLGDGKDKEAMTHIETAKRVGYRGPELARALTEYGKMFVQFDFANGSKYLEEAISLQAPESLSDAYESLMLCALYANKKEEALSIAKRMVAAPGLAPVTAGRARDFVKSSEFEKKLLTPDAVLDQLVIQLQGQGEKRDMFYFKSMFLPGALVTSVFRSPKHGMMRTQVEVDTWIEVNGTDKLKVILKQRDRKLETRGEMAQAWLEYEAEATLPNGEFQTFKGTLAVTMAMSGDRWLIASLIQQSATEPPRRR